MTQKPDIDPGKWRDISGVFAAAAALEGASRQAYLDSACQHDPALRAAVDSLLDAHNNAGSFGATPLFASSTAVKRLAPGSQLGTFRIETLLGAGGMGEVYRAHDTKLQRAVAIKVLPDFLAQNADRLARFGEEARALAALNHPHVGAIYGLEESAGIAALVLELVEGPTLAERLAVGPLAFDEVVWITRQLAEGLEAAHERGIVHRDLKPANIKITPDGNLKILDFGLAKTAASPPGPALTPSTTSPREATQFGMVLGTVGYMSPEQARGQAVDKRTDIWAFGCVLFEMCAHQPPFAGATISDAQAAVIEREPDWHLLRGGTPANLIRVLRRCLTKDPKQRLRDIGEARIALDQDTDTANPAPRSTTRRVAVITAILATVASFAIAFAVFGPPRSGLSVSPSSVRFEVPPPDGAQFRRLSNRTFFALSPDGLQLAFVTLEEPGSPGRVWVRAVADLVAQPLRGTDNATSVFWSPDGRSLAFFAERKLMRIDLSDGVVVKICDDVEAAFSHGTWGVGGVILLGRNDGTSIAAVPAAGGSAPVPILHLNQSKGEVRVHWPWFLPDGKRFLYTARRDDDGEGEVRLAQLRPNDREGNAQPVQLDEGTRTVMSASSNAQWVDPDVVVFVREGVLMAQRVDVEVRPVAKPFPITGGVQYSFTTSQATFSASRTGSVAYHSGQTVAQLVRADRNGNQLGTISSPSDWDQTSARLKWDDSVLLAARRRASLGTHDIWRMDLVRTTERQLTSNSSNEVSPVFIDDRTIVFAGDSLGSLPHLFRKDLITGLEEQILPAGNQQRAMDVFADGRAAYMEQLGTRFQLFQLPLTGGAYPTPLSLGPLSNASNMRLSPDRRLMTYIAQPHDGSASAGIGSAGPVCPCIYVDLVPGTSAPVVATERFFRPAQWSRDGRRIYYQSDGTLMTVAVSTVPRLTVGAPEPLFKLPPNATLMEVFLDGSFLLLVPQVHAVERPITVWTAAITSTRQ